MTAIIYIALAIAFLVLVLSLLRRSRHGGPDTTLGGKTYAPIAGSGRWLDLSQRIFDPSDARWLHDELAFPKLAAALTLRRKQLAICWLESLEASLDELVRTPELSPSETSETSSAADWNMLWLTLRVKLLVYYALLVVRLFGPYHRLIPSFSWVPVPQANHPSFRRPTVAHEQNSR